jgi:hypothetical protein
MPELEFGVRAWWLALSAIGIVNIGFVAMLWRDARARTAELDATRTRAWRRLLFFGTVFALVCASRSFIPRADVQRICLVDGWISTVFVGRSLATIGELSFVAQWAILLREYATDAGVRASVIASRLCVPVIALAECFSWSSVITTSYLGNTCEESLWMLTAGAMTVALVPVALRAERKLRSRLFLAIGGGASYVLFMALHDVPMYFTRWRADVAADKPIFGVFDGLRDVATRYVVTGRFDDWREEMPWMTLYFSFAVWMALALSRAPRFRRDSSTAASST